MSVRDITQEELNEMLIDHKLSKHVMLSNLNLQGLDFSLSSLYNLSLVNCKLANANFSYSNLISVNFSGADLTCVDFTGAKLEYCSLNSCDMKRTNLCKAHLYNVDVGKVKNGDTIKSDSETLILNDVTDSNAC